MELRLMGDMQEASSQRKSKTTEIEGVHLLCYNVSRAKRAPSSPDVTERWSPAFRSRCDDCDGLLRADPLSRRRRVFNELELSACASPPRGPSRRTGRSSSPICSWRTGVLRRSRLVPTVHLECDAGAC